MITPLVDYFFIHIWLTYAKHQHPCHHQYTLKESWVKYILDRTQKTPIITIVFCCRPHQSLADFSPYRLHTYTSWPIQMDDTTHRNLKFFNYPIVFTSTFDNEVSCVRWLTAQVVCNGILHHPGFFLCNTEELWGEWTNQENMITCKTDGSKGRIKILWH